MLLTTFIGFCSSLAASFCFLYIILYCMRPKIVISSYISKRVNEYDTESEYVYVFKVVNKSRHPAFDASIELFNLLYYPAEDGRMNTRYTPLSLKKSRFARIPSRKGFNRRSSFAEHCVLFRTGEDLNEILKEESRSIQLQITVKHGLTGLSRCFTKTYAKCNDIKVGHHNFGDDLGIN